MLKSFSASIQSLPDILTFICEQAIRLEIDEDSVAKIQLACEEAIVNIIHYAYPHQEGTIDVNCIPLPIEESGIKILIRDHGIPFNPLENVKNMKTNNPMKNGSPGGYGIYLMLNIMDEASYLREGNYNVLTFIKRHTKKTS